MDIQKEREEFENWYIRNMDINSDFEKISEQDSPYMDEHVNNSWLAWQAAKAQAMPSQPTQFNLDEFLSMEEKLKHKGGVITADLDRFIAYAEMVLEKAKALKESK